MFPKLDTLKRGPAVCAFILLVILSQSFAQSEAGSPHPSLLNRDNLVAWCVAYRWDAENRSPRERARMLSELGLRKLAINARPEDKPDHAAEIDACREYGIELIAFWNEDEIAFSLFEAEGLSPQVWKIPASPKVASQEKKVILAANKLVPLAKRTQAMGSQLGLYNHGGWSGKPGNLIAICKELRKRGYEHVGLVYNFHHAHDRIDQFREDLTAMLPYLICLNLNGMANPADVNPVTKENKILPIGAGVHEKAMIDIILESGYEGPIGILGHLETQDAAKSLNDNLEGLEKLFP